MNTTTMNTGAASLSDEQILNVLCGQDERPFHQPHGTRLVYNAFEDEYDLREIVLRRARELIALATTPQADAAPVDGATVKSGDVTITGVPRRIFLNLGDIYGLDTELPFSQLTDVTWCEDQIGNDDVEYVRAAIAAGGAQEADVLEWIETELSAISCRYHGDPSYDHDAYWMKDRVMKLIADARKAFALPRVAATVALTDEQMMAAIKSVCGFDAEKAEQWRPEALTIGRAVERALLAESTSANVAQGAEAVQFVFPPMPQAVVMHEKLGPLFDRLSMHFYADKCMRISAPPAQTAITDAQWLELRRIARTYNETGFPKHAREFFAALTAAQSASEGNHAG